MLEKNVDLGGPKNLWRHLEKTQSAKTPSTPLPLPDVLKQKMTSVLVIVREVAAS